MQSDAVCHSGRRTPKLAPKLAGSLTGRLAPAVLAGCVMLAGATGGAASAAQQWPPEARDGRYCDGKARDQQGAMASPFMMIDQSIGLTSLPWQICGLDPAGWEAYWHSYFDYFGCGPDSEAGQRLEKTLAHYNIRDVERMDALKQQEPELIGEFCAEVGKIDFPTVFNPETMAWYPYSSPDSAADSRKLNKLQRMILRKARQIGK